MEKQSLENTKENKISDMAWDGFLVMGIVISMLLSLLQNERSTILLITFCLIMFVMSDIKENFKALVKGLKKYWVFPVWTAVYVGYYYFVPKDIQNVQIGIMCFLMGVTGFCLSYGRTEFFESAYRQLWVFLLAVTILNMVKIVLDKTTGYFQDGTVELGALIIFAALSVLFVESIYVRLGCVALVAIELFLLIRTHALTLNVFKGYNGMVSVAMKELLFAAALILGIRIFLKASDTLDKRKALFLCITVIVGMVLCVPHREALVVVVFSIIGCFFGWNKQ
ncbi:hypothetical protein [Butyrivibrio sp. FC2001]|uniref:hypothetical protein n=1 Tax=Butyrivibrio sp. FC2001 TaxID=1280671 RepID=UPI00040CE6B8|nr:hypothetical protein [Butyrivibrio sp. FC2001]